MSFHLPRLACHEIVNIVVDAPPRNIDNDKVQTVINKNTRNTKLSLLTNLVKCMEYFLHSDKILESLEKFRMMRKLFETFQ